MRALFSISALLVFVFFTTDVLADYQSWMMKFEVKTTDGAIHLLYQSKALSYIDEDSINSEHYAMRMVYTMNQNFGDTVHFYQALFKYQYQAPESDHKSAVYQLLDEKVLLKSSITSIRYINHYETTYAIGLLNNLTSRDTNWMKKPVKAYRVYDGIMCSWEVLVHRPSKEINTKLAELDEYQRGVNIMLTSMEADIENNPENREELEKRFEMVIEDIDALFYSQLKMLSNTKAIMVSFCSC